MNGPEHYRQSEVTLSVVEVLERAADILERCGRHVENFEAHRGGPCCAAGAINRAVTGDAECGDASVPVLRALVIGAGLDDRVDGYRVGYEDQTFGYDDYELLVDLVGRWNDAAGRTDAEVLSVLRGLAARLRGDG